MFHEAYHYCITFTSKKLLPLSLLDNNNHICYLKLIETEKTPTQILCFFYQRFLVSWRKHSPSKQGLQCCWLGAGRVLALSLLGSQTATFGMALDCGYKALRKKKRVFAVISLTRRKIPKDRVSFPIRCIDVRCLI